MNITNLDKDVYNLCKTITYKSTPESSKLWRDTVLMLNLYHNYLHTGKNRDSLVDMISLLSTKTSKITKISTEKQSIMSGYGKKAKKYEEKRLEKYLFSSEDSSEYSFSSSSSNDGEKIVEEVMKKIRSKSKKHKKLMEKEINLEIKDKQKTISLSIKKTTSPTKKKASPVKESKLEEIKISRFIINNNGSGSVNIVNGKKITSGENIVRVSNEEMMENIIKDPETGNKGFKSAFLGIPIIGSLINYSINWVKELVKPPEYSVVGILSRVNHILEGAIVFFTIGFITYYTFIGAHSLYNSWINLYNFLDNTRNTIYNVPTNITNLATKTLNKFQVDLYNGITNFMEGSIPSFITNGKEVGDIGKNMTVIKDQVINAIVTKMNKSSTIGKIPITRTYFSRSTKFL